MAIELENGQQADDKKIILAEPAASAQACAGR
jgi:hypothetical protein